MKKEIREQARLLRQENGLSIKNISEKLNVAKSTVSLWVKDIELNDEQKMNLSGGNNNLCGYSKCSEKWRNKRRQYQLEGHDLALKNNAEYAFGCALYLGEGSKAQNTVTFCNTDPKVIKFFVDFLRKYFYVKNEDFKLSFNCYLNNNLSIIDIENYWLNLLDLPETCIRKATIKNKYYGNRTVKHLYGVCRIRVHSTKIVQNIYGSIKKYIKDDSNIWLDIKK